MSSYSSMVCHVPAFQLTLLRAERFVYSSELRKAALQAMPGSRNSRKCPAAVVSLALSQCCHDFLDRLAQDTQETRHRKFSIGTLTCSHMLNICAELTWTRRLGMHVECCLNALCLCAGAGCNISFKYAYVWLVVCFRSLKTGMQSYSACGRVSSS